MILRSSLILIFLSFAACSSSKTDNTGGACSQGVINANNDVYFACTSMWNESDGLECQAEAQNFLDSYPNIDCKAENLSDGGTKWITSEDIEEVLAEINGILSSN
ncbi:MAG: hypothetical protein ACRBBP_05285 [Bdellovibrionales bacterium]